ncbi:MAG: hypothetical protein GQ477_05855 [Nanohaloarchaea archaeon]|nr:hypothetical protein [Candidatus Nanohaloarchaea archaeon]
MSKINHIFDTLKIGTGLIGVKETSEYLDADVFGSVFEDVYSVIVESGDMLSDLSYPGIDYLGIFPDKELMVGFGIGIISNLAAGFIKSEYGSITNLMRCKRLKEESIYSRFR